MINQIVTKISEAEFARALKFEEGILPECRPVMIEKQASPLYAHPFL